MSRNLISLAKKLFRRFTRKPGSGTLNRFRPRLEAFEDRTVPAIASIATLADATEGGSAGSFRISRDSISPSPLTVNYTVGGTATEDEDYTALSGTVTFAANATTADATVTVLNDSDTEFTESVVVWLQPDADYNLGEDAEASVGIADTEWS